MDTPDSTTLKRCTKCGEEKPRDQFGKREDGKAGLCTWCKVCKAAYLKGYRAANRERLALYDKEYRTANHERLAEYRRIWEESNKEYRRAKRRDYYNKERHAKHVSAWYEANKERKNAQVRAWREANKDRNNDNKRSWRKANPDKDKSAAHRRKARKRLLPHTLTAADWQVSLDYFRNCCAACGQQLNGLFHSDHMDHWIPLKSPDCPGTVPHNMVPLCSTCNMSKQDKPADEWLVWKFGPRKGRAILRKIEAFLESRKQDAA